MSSAGKGDKWRPINKAKYDACPLWKNLEKKTSMKSPKKNEDDNPSHAMCISKTNNHK